MVCGMAYATAWAETFTIESFPYYTFRDRDAMYSIGSVLYALYFVVSFPAYHRCVAMALKIQLTCFVKADAPWLCN